MRTTYTVSSVSAVVDSRSVVLGSGRQIDWSLVPESYRTTAQTITVGVGGAAQGATTVPVVALPVALPKGLILQFGTDEFVKLSAAAAEGATSISVEALINALEAADTAVYGGTGKKVLPQHCAVGDELGNGKLAPRVATTNPAIGLLATNAIEDDPSAGMSGYGVVKGGVFYENMLPDATGTPKELPAAIKTELQASGTGYAFEQFGDSRAV
jgi:hypothetical protein